MTHATAPLTPEGRGRLAVLIVDQGWIVSRTADRLRERLVDLVANGTDVVLDFAFWSRAVRDDYRRLLAPFGVVPETYYLATPRDVAEAHFDGFEVPTPDEGPLHILTGSMT